MIIFVSGDVGAGKSTIAKWLADEFDCHYYEVDAVKGEVYRQDPSFERNFREGIEFSMETRARVYERVIEDLDALRNDHEYVVVDEVLYTRKLRHTLYEAAEKLFGSFIIVWVRADEDVLLDRLRSKKRVGHLLDDPVPMHNANKEEFQEFNRSVIVCSNNGTPQEAISHLKALITGATRLAGRRPEGQAP